MRLYRAHISNMCISSGTLEPNAAHFLTASSTWLDSMSVRISVSIGVSVEPRGWFGLAFCGLGSVWSYCARLSLLARTSCALAAALNVFDAVGQSVTSGWFSFAMLLNIGTQWQLVSVLQMVSGRSITKRSQHMYRVKRALAHEAPGWLGMGLLRVMAALCT